MSAPNCCKISAPRLPGVCTNFLTGLGEAMAASDNGDNPDWWGCKQQGGVIREMPRYPMECLKVGHRNGKREHTKTCSVHLLTSRRECDNLHLFQLPGLQKYPSIFPSISICILKSSLKVPRCPQQCLDLHVLDNNKWEDAHRSAKELQKRKLNKKTPLWWDCDHCWKNCCVPDPDLFSPAEPGGCQLSKGKREMQGNLLHWLLLSIADAVKI